MAEAAINWDENLPSGSSAVKLGDNDIRNLTVALGDGLDAEHHWDNTQGTANRGLHRPGSGRAYVDVQSNLSDSGTSAKGKLYYASDRSRLFVTPLSTVTCFVGGYDVPIVRTVDDVRPIADGLSVPYIESGSGAGGTNVAFAGKNYTTPPVVFTTSDTEAAGYCWVSSVTSGGFAAETGPVGGGDFTWLSLGTYPLVSL